MKKKILGVGIVVMLVVMLFILTGCGNNDNVKKETTSNIDNVSNNSNNSKGITISKIIAPYSKGVAIVKGQNSQYYAIDENGKMLVNVSKYISNDNDNIIVSNGYIIVNPIETNNTYGVTLGKSMVLDKNGEILLDKQDNVGYGEVSVSGYISVARNIKGVDGNKNKVTIEDFKGNILKDTSYYYPWECLGDDLFFTEEDGGILYNAKENTELKLSDINETSTVREYSNGYIVMGSGNLINRNLKDVYNLGKKGIKYESIINDKYILGTDNNDKVGLYTYDGNLAVEIKGSKNQTGSTYDVFEYKGIYYIRTNTEFLYTLDQNLKEIIEPVEHTSNLILSDSGIITKVNSAWSIIDEKGDSTTNLFEKSYSDIDTSLLGKSGFNHITSNYIYFKDGSIYNIKDKKYIEIYE